MLVFNKIVISLLQTGELVALKKVPLRKLDDGIPNSALRYRVIPKLSVSTIMNLVSVCMSSCHV